MYLIKYALAHTLALALNVDIEEIKEKPKTPPPPIRRVATPVPTAKIESIRDLRILRLSPSADDETSVLFYKGSNGNLIPLEDLFDESDLETEDDDWVIGAEFDEDDEDLGQRNQEVEIDSRSNRPVLRLVPSEPT